MDGDYPIRAESADNCRARKSRNIKPLLNHVELTRLSALELTDTNDFNFAAPLCLFFNGPPRAFNQGDGNIRYCYNF